MDRAREVAIREAKEARENAEREARSRADAEISLSESQALFSTLFRRAPSVLILSSLQDGRIRDVNEGFVETSGWTAAEAVGKTLTELDAWSHQADRNRLKELVADSNLPNYVEIQLRKKNREFVHLLASADVLMVGGEPCLLAQGVDITEQKRAQEALAVHQKELEARVEESGEQLKASIARLEDQERLVAVGTLAAGIAHQINNPVRAIATIAELSLLEKDGQRADSVVRAMERILEEARRCGQ
ncbi:MAG: hypothetical protein CL908_22740, partial [Deltaproteobacteria bacterium]|nr:hypothetical protein [Deltaproteobacteria bacterium]